MVKNLIKRMLPHPLMQLVRKFLKHMYWRLAGKRELEVFEELTHYFNNTPVTVQIVDGALTGNLLVGTHSGLIFISGSKAYRIIAGHVYGIALTQVQRDPDIFEIIVQQNMHRLTRISRISIHLIPEAGKNETLEDSVEIRDIKTIFTLPTLAVHQIDVHDSYLYICDTNENRILVCSLDGNILRICYPTGKIFNGDLDGKDYHHFNSVYVKEDRIYVVAHNGFAKTNKHSELYLIDRGTLKTISVEEMNASSAHNIVPLPSGQYLFNDSSHGVLRRDQEELSKLEGWFTRGLAVNKNYIYFGGSSISPRKLRASSDGIIKQIDHAGRVVGSILLKGVGGVQEIRILGEDISRSNNV